MRARGFGASEVHEEQHDGGLIFQLVSSHKWFVEWMFSRSGPHIRLDGKIIHSGSNISSGWT